MTHQITMQVKTDCSAVQPLYDLINEEVSKLDPTLAQKIGKAFEILLERGDFLFEITTLIKGETPQDSSQYVVRLYPKECFLQLVQAVLTKNYQALFDC